MRCTVRSGVLSAIVLVIAAGCSSSDDAAVVTTGAIERPTPVVTVTDTAATATIDPSTSSAITVVSVVEGVPGIESDDPFCRGWSEFAGTFQALAFVSAAGSDPAAASRSEVAASGAVLAAVATIDGAFPDEVAADRESFVVGLLGPFARRAERARGELLAAGLGEVDVEQLGALWLASLAAGGLDPDLTIDVPEPLVAAVDRAASAFASNVPPIGADPSLVTDAEAPATLAYIADTCPDQGTLGGNDLAD